MSIHLKPHLTITESYVFFCMVFDFFFLFFPTHNEKKKRPGVFSPWFYFQITKTQTFFNFLLFWVRLIDKRY